MAKQKTGHWLKMKNWGSELLKQAQNDLKCCSPKVIPNLIRDLGEPVGKPNLSFDPSRAGQAKLRMTNWGSEILKRVQNDSRPQMKVFEGLVSYPLKANKSK